MTISKLELWCAIDVMRREHDDDLKTNDRDRNLVSPLLNSLDEAIQCGIWVMAQDVPRGKLDGLGVLIDVAKGDQWVSRAESDLMAFLNKIRGRASDVYLAIPADRDELAWVVDFLKDVYISIEGAPTFSGT